MTAQISGRKSGVRKAPTYERRYETRGTPRFLTPRQLAERKERIARWVRSCRRRAR